MLNQTLKNKVAPWQEKGRWYHILIESDGTTHSITESDLEVSVTGHTTLTLPVGFHAIETKCIDVDINPSKTINTAIVKTSSAGVEILTLPSEADYTYYEIIIFGFFKEV